MCVCSCETAYIKLLQAFPGECINCVQAKQDKILCFLFSDQPRLASDLTYMLLILHKNNNQKHNLSTERAAIVGAKERCLKVMLQNVK